MKKVERCTVFCKDSKKLLKNANSDIESKKGKVLKNLADSTWSLAQGSLQGNTGKIAEGLTKAAVGVVGEILGPSLAEQDLFSESPKEKYHCIVKSQGKTLRYTVIFENIAIQ